MPQALDLGTARRLKQLRKHRPQAEIAEAVGVSLRAYQLWEAGHRISGRNVDKLAGLYKVDPNWLIYGTDIEQAPESDLERLEGRLEHIERLLELVALSTAPMRQERELGGAVGPISERVADSDAYAQLLRLPPQAH